MNFQRLYLDVVPAGGMLRYSRAIASRIAVAYFRVRSRFGRRPLVDPTNSGFVVSMTSYGARIRLAHIAVESVGRGRVRPGRLVLWLNDLNSDRPLPPSILRAMSRGLEVRESANFGPHTKYFPAVQTLIDDDQSLVTADDDVLYPRYWLEELASASRRWPHEVLCFRAHAIRAEAGGIARYSDWPRQASSDSGPTVLATGVSGVLYPPAMVEVIREYGEAFTEVARRNDDIWLHHVALQEGIAVRQIRPTAMHFLTVPGTRTTMLASGNVSGGQNDRIIENLYTQADVERLLPPDTA